MDNLPIVLSIVAIFISIASLNINWLRYRDGSYHLDFYVYWKGDFVSNKDNTFELKIINFGGQTVEVREIGYYINNDKNEKIHKQFCTLQKFDEPIVISPKSGKDFIYSITDSDLADAFKVERAMIWIEDGMFRKYENFAIWKNM